VEDFGDLRFKIQDLRFDLKTNFKGIKNPYYTAKLKIKIETGQKSREFEEFQIQCP